MAAAFYVPTKHILPNFYAPTRRVIHFSTHRPPLDLLSPYTPTGIRAVLNVLVTRQVANGTDLVQFQQDLAFFLLARGPYTWLGWGVWGMTWPFNAEPAHGTLPPLPHGVPRPAALDLDYGRPAPRWKGMG